MSRRRSSLFRRIYATFVATVLAAAAVVGVGVFLYTRSSGEWVAATMERLDADNDTLVAELDDLEALREHLAAMDATLHTRSGVYDLVGNRVAGRGPEYLPPRLRRSADGSMRPHVHHGGSSGRRMVAVPLVDGDGNALAVVHVVDAPPDRWPWIAPIVVVALVGLALGARRLARSLTRRISALEDSVGRIAGGELTHRVATPAQPVDEVDELGVAVNEMATRLERLVGSQRTLLANVSHELRTPLARIKVLLEILQERLEVLRRPAGPEQLAGFERMRSGLGELEADVGEIEVLIHDLLTSGRLELRAGAGAALDAHELALAPMLRRVAGRFAARCEADDDLVLVGDELLLERLVSNLLANARRACPEGEVSITAAADDTEVHIWVEDRGPGIAPEHREQVFEPFRRLDDARSRDRGGVGLGLYLCRQICRAHGGTIAAVARRDGARGACLRVSLPCAPGASVPDATAVRA